LKGAAPTELLLVRSEELARIESALAEDRSGRGTFVVVEGPGRELERADLLEASAGVAAGLLGLPGAPATEGAPASAEYQAIVMPAGIPPRQGTG
jgi:hypothetical protein